MAQRIGIDVGGTNVKIALVSDKGKNYLFKFYPDESGDGVRIYN